jgi:hypothetical protein
MSLGLMPWRNFCSQDAAQSDGAGLRPISSIGDRVAEGMCLLKRRRRHKWKFRAK